MKPYDYSGGGYSNLEHISKWSGGFGTRREHRRRACATADRVRRAVGRRARQLGRKECREATGGQR